MSDLHPLEPQTSWADGELRFWQMPKTARVEIQERRALLSEIQGNGSAAEADCLVCGVIGTTREAWGVK